MVPPVVGGRVLGVEGAVVCPNVGNIVSTRVEVNGVGVGAGVGVVKGGGIVSGGSMTKMAASEASTRNFC